MLTIDLEPGESVSIGDIAVVTLRDKSGRRARIEFKADRSIPIRRVSERSADSRIAEAVGIGG